MARIISGSQQDTNFALLQGTQIGREWGAARHAKNEDQRRQGEFLMGMQESAMRLQQARAEREEMMNRNAQMGDAHALQEMALKAKMNPAQARRMDFMTLLQGIQDPKARALALPAAEAIIASEDRFDEFSAAGRQWTRAQKDVEAGIYTPEEVQEWGGQLESAFHGGGSAAPIMKAMQEKRAKHVEAGQIQEENEKYLAQAQAYYETLPPGTYEQQRAGMILKSHMAPSALSEKGNGAEALRKVQMAGLGTQSGFEGRELKARGGMDLLRARGLQDYPQGQERAGLEMAAKKGVPQPAPGTHATVKATQGAGKMGRGKQVDPRAVTLEVIGSVQDDASLLQALKERGVRLTPTNIAAVKATIEEWRGRAAQGADR